MHKVCVCVCVCFVVLLVACNKVVIVRTLTSSKMMIHFDMFYTMYIMKPLKNQLGCFNTPLLLVLCFVMNED